MPSRQTRTYVLFALSVGALLLLSACAAQPAGSPGAPAFWSGLGHGLIAPIAFIVSLFNDDVRMYAFPNDGRWYDFGFLLGISTWGGGVAASR